MALQTGGVAARGELLADLGNVIMAKPKLADLKELREGGILSGLSPLRAAARNPPDSDDGSVPGGGVGGRARSLRRSAARGRG